MTERTVNHGVLLIGHAFHEVTVVADHQQGARPGVQQIFHRGEHIGIQVVGRLVENQHVRFIQQNQHELQATLLTTRQVLDRGRQLCTGKAQTLQHLRGGQLLTIGNVATLLATNHIRDAVVSDLVELIELLSQGRNLHGFTVLDAALGRLQLTGDQGEQSRLTRAVHAQDAGALAGGDTPGDLLQHGTLTAGH